VTAPVLRRGSVGDTVIGVVLLVVFVAGFVAALDFPFRAALVPRIVCAAGAVFAALFLLRVVVERRGAPAVARPAPAPPVEAGDEDGASEDYVFGTASGRTWLEVLLWFAGFFVALALLGAVLAVPLFAAAYLLVVGRVHPVWAVVYAAALWVVLFVGFDRVLELSLPTGSW
jgi:Tripartite tricarboxylate transporter TctB family